MGFFFVCAVIVLCLIAFCGMLDRDLKQWEKKQKEKDREAAKDKRMGIGDYPIRDWKNKK